MLKIQAKPRKTTAGVQIQCLALFHSENSSQQHPSVLISLARPEVPFPIARCPVCSRSLGIKSEDYGDNHVASQVLVMGKRRQEKADVQTGWENVRGTITYLDLEISSRILKVRKSAPPQPHSNRV